MYYAFRYKLYRKYVDMLEKGKQTRRIAAYEVSQISKDLAKELLDNAKGFVNRLREIVA